MRSRSHAAHAALMCVWLSAAAAHGAALDLPAALPGDDEARAFADLAFTHGALSYGDGDYARALEQFEAAAATAPDDPTYRYLAALCRIRLGEIERAIDELRGVLEAGGARVPPARVHYALGEAEAQRGDSAAAEREFRAATRLDPRDGYAHFQLGSTLLALGQSDEAFVEFEHAGAVEPALGASSAYYLGVDAAREGRTEDARRLLERAAAAARDPGLAASGADWRALLDTPAESFDVPRGELRIAVGAAYDDNPARLGEAVRPLVPASDAGWRAVAQVRAAANPVVDRGGWTVGFVGQAYGTYHEDFEEGDLEGVQGVFQAAWGGDRLGLLTGPLGYARVPLTARRVGLLVQLGSTFFDRNGQSTRRDNEGALSLAIQEGRFGKTQLEADYRDQEFFEALFEPFTGSAASAGLSQLFYLGREDRWLRVAGSRSSVTAELQGLEREFQNFSAELALPAGRRSTLVLYGLRSDVDWDDESALLFPPFPFQPVVAEPREDTLSAAQATLTVLLSRHLYVMVRGEWSERAVTPDYLEGQFGYARVGGSAGVTVFW